VVAVVVVVIWWWCHMNHVINLNVYITM